MEDKNEIYFMGKVFDDLEEAMHYQAEWMKEELNLKDAERMAILLGKEIVVNAALTCPNMTNGEFKKKLNEIFEESIKILRSS